MDKSQEPKYDIVDGKIVNRATGKAIPDDEPVMIFRAQDQNARVVIDYYRDLCRHESHRAVVEQRYRDFARFAQDHPDRMKEPDSEPIT